MDIHTALYKYIKGDATPEERRKVLLWLKQDESHAKEYREMRKLHNLDIWNRPEPQARTSKRRPLRLRRIGMELLKIASVLIIGIFITLYISDADEPETTFQAINVPSGQRAELVLSDGTQVWLNSGTRLLLPDHFASDTRDLQLLDGEAYFRVAKDAARPFTVYLDGYNVRVLGTEFNVKTYARSGVIETALIEGSVEVETSDGVRIDRLKANDILLIRDGQVNKTSITDYSHYRWREGLICFDNEHLVSLFAKLELYYDIRIEIRDKSLLQWNYTGKFRVRDGIDHVLRTLQLKHKFKYTRNEDTNTIVIE